MDALNIIMRNYSIGTTGPVTTIGDKKDSDGGVAIVISNTEQALCLMERFVIHNAIIKNSGANYDANGNTYSYTGIMCGLVNSST